MAAGTSLPEGFLLPCPFCGGAGAYSVGASGVYCPQCIATTASVARWNARADKARDIPKMLLSPRAAVAAILAISLADDRVKRLLGDDDQREAMIGAIADAAASLDSWSGAT